MISYEVPLERYGKSCIRFRRIEDLPLEVIGRAVARTSVEDLIAFYKTGRNRRG